METSKIKQWPWTIALIGLILAGLSGCARHRESPTSDPAAWEIKREYVFTPYLRFGTDDYIRDLMRRLASNEGDGAPVSQDEFLALLDRPESREVYTDQLIKVATPRSVQIQNQEHADYLHVFMQESRQQAGVRFLHDHEALLSEAEQRYGVARRDIVSILMWESGLGEFTGELRVFNVFMAQLLFLEHAQAQAVAQMIEKGEPNLLQDPSVVENQEKRFIRIKNRCVENLVALLRYCKANGVDPLEQRGSWGGAIGYTQFIPASIPYAVDGDRDGNIDLHAWPDAIFSVANYLKQRGQYGVAEEARRKAIFSYNPIDSYVNGVITYAEAIWTRYEQGE